VSEPFQTNPIETVQAERIGRQAMRLDEVCLHLGVSRDLVEVCLRWEVVGPIQAQEDDIRLNETEVERLRRALRLHHDLGVNWPGVTIILDLLERMETLERELQSRLDSW
jgi:chaperone modulatory protein CbpM